MEGESESEVTQSCPTLCDPMDLYSPWNSPGQYTGVGSLSLLQGIFPTQVLNLGLPHCRQTLYPLSLQGRVFQITKWIEMKSVHTHLEIDLLPVVWISHLILKEIISIYWLWWQFIGQWLHPIYVNLSNMLFFNFSWTYKCSDFLHSSCKKTFKI